MKLNEDYENKAPNFDNLDSMEGVQLAMDMLEWNVLNKFDLDTKDLIGYALIRSYIDNIAQKAHAYDQLSEVYKN
jgi:hypothetical protein